MDRYDRSAPGFPISNVYSGRTAAKYNCICFSRKPRLGDNKYFSDIGNARDVEGSYTAISWPLGLNSCGAVELGSIRLVSSSTGTRRELSNATKMNKHCELCSMNWASLECKAKTSLFRASFTMSMSCASRLEKDPNLVFTCGRSFHAVTRCKYSDRINAG